MDKVAIINKAVENAGGKDDRTPNQKRLDEIIEQNEEMFKQSEDIIRLNTSMLSELQKMNSNLAIVGAALIKMVEPKAKKGKAGE